MLLLYDKSPGLPPLDLVLFGTIIGGVLILIGWGLSNSTSENKEKGSSLGGGLFLIGALCLIPVAIWIQAIGATIMGVILLLCLVIGVVKIFIGK